MSISSTVAYVLSFDSVIQINNAGLRAHRSRSFTPRLLPLHPSRRQPLLRQPQLRLPTRQSLINQPIRGRTETVQGPRADLFWLADGHGGQAVLTTSRGGGGEWV